MKFKRIILVFNPRSSKYVRVREEVLNPLMKREGVLLGKFEVEPTNVDENASRLARILEDGDLVITAGGDGTATIGLNGVVQSKQDVKFAVLPYGNFNDTARLLDCRNVDEILDGKTREIYPLVAEIDGRVWRRATCYFTIGMLAESTEAFDQPSTRKSLRKGKQGMFFSIWTLFKWWRRNRKREFLPKEIFDRKTDILAVNGKSVAKIMKGDPKTAYSKDKFIASVQNLRGFFGIAVFMAKSVLFHVPGVRKKSLKIDFGKRTKVEIQAEGEYVTKAMTTLKIYKSDEPVSMVTRRK
ncbi:MAG: diacylglycerol kinase family protein [Candidatus Saccharibacteria bacterium]|nr:diacylglycerol kinase family protein [Candidatus Saccharibacteria bacterium]